MAKNNKQHKQGYRRPAGLEYTGERFFEKYKNLSTEELAKRLGYSKMYIQNMRGGHERVSQGLVEAAYKNFGDKVDLFLVQTPETALAPNIALAPTPIAVAEPAPAQALDTPAPVSSTSNNTFMQSLIDEARNKVEEAKVNQTLIIEQIAQNTIEIDRLIKEAAKLEAANNSLQSEMEASTKAIEESGVVISYLEQFELKPKPTAPAKVIQEFTDNVVSVVEQDLKAREANAITKPITLPEPTPLKVTPVGFDSRSYLGQRDLIAYNSYKNNSHNKNVR